MRFRKIYYFNDGLDGVVVAKSLKHAVRILCKEAYKGMDKEILDSIQKSQNDPYGIHDWYVEWFKTKRKSGLVGWCE